MRVTPRCPVPEERSRGSFSVRASGKVGSEALASSLFANANEQEALLLWSCQNKRRVIFPSALLTVSAPYPVTVTTENDLGKRDPIMRPK